MSKTGTTSSVKILLLFAIVAIFGVFIVSLVRNVADSVNVLKKVNFSYQDFDNGFANMSYQLQINETNLFVVKADQAKRITNNLVLFDNIAVERIEGDIDFSVKAEYGSFDEILKLLILNQSVEISYTGNIAISEEARLNIENYEIFFPERVRIVSETYNINSSALKYDAERNILLEAHDFEYFDITSNDFLKAKIILGDVSNPEILKAQNVELKNRDIVLTGRDFTVTLADKNKVTNIDGKKNIVMVSPKYKIISEAMHYNPVLALIEFTGDVTLISEGGEVKGQALVYDINSDTAKFSGGNNSNKIKIKIDK